MMLQEETEWFWKPENAEFKITIRSTKKNFNDTDAIEILEKMIRKLKAEEELTIIIE